MNRHRFVWSWLPVLLVAASAAAQPVGRPASQGPQGRAVTEKDRMRLQIAAMEGVLANAVAQIHSQALEAVMPAMFTFEGGSRARGFRLEGYGLFFDVDLPPLPRSIVWSVRMLDTPVEIDSELASLRRQVAAVNDPRLRQEFEQTIRRIQGKVMASGVSNRPDNVMISQAPNQKPGVEMPDEDPFRTYAANLGNALAEVLVNYGGTIDLAPDDWLTIAAREMQPRLLPGGPVETAITLRIKGADLAAFKTGKISHDEARKRVEISEF